MAVIPVCPPTPLLCTALTIDEVRVIAALAQLHHGIDEVGHIVLVGTLGEEGEILLQDGPVVFLLDIGQLHLNDGLLLGCQILLYIVLQPSQHHGLQDGLQLLHLQSKRTQSLPSPHGKHVGTEDGSARLEPPHTANPLQVTLEQLLSSQPGQLQGPGSLGQACQ